MFCLWTCLTLLYALQSRVSSDQAVSLLCNKTVEVKSGENMTLNCSINWKDGSNCRVQNNSWEDTNGPIPCERNNTKYICEQDPLTYVSLTILEVLEEKNATGEIKSNCGQIVHQSTATSWSKQEDKSWKRKSGEVTCDDCRTLCFCCCYTRICFLCIGLGDAQKCQ